VVVDLEETDPEIMRPGLSVKIVVLANRLDDALLAPRSALDLTTEPPSAHLADGGTVPVELGPCNAQVCVVASGLGEGDTLAAAAGGAE
jgi:hypothetical protein